MPTNGQQRELWSLARKNRPIEPKLLKQAVNWRALRLPFRSQASVQFTWWALEQGVLEAMASFSHFKKDPELSSDGVTRFWSAMEEYLKETKS